MRRFAGLTAALGLLFLSACLFAQEDGAEPGRLRTQVVTDGPTFWVYTIDTATGRTWFLAGEHVEGWTWADNGASPNGAGPVGTYQLVAFANDKGAHIYVSDTTTGELWRIDEDNLRWLPRGMPSQSSDRAGAGTPGAIEPGVPGRFSTQVAVDGEAFWVHTIDTTTGRAWFLDRERDDEWEWVDNGAAPNGPGPVGRYQLVSFANEKGAHLYVTDTTTGQLWRVNERDGGWLSRGRPVERDRSKAAGRPSI